MLIRSASIADSQDVLAWRNDEFSRSMFFDSNKISDKDHEKWFEKLLASENSSIVIGEQAEGKVGVCRFDFDNETGSAEVSINLNPSFRGKGLSANLLGKAIENYIGSHDVDLIARVKNNNTASRKIFSRVGFYKKNVSANEVTFILPRNKLVFKPVTAMHSKILYELLAKRNHGISHQQMPAYSEHKEFVVSKPYLHWYLICAEEPVGTFYIQEDNSIGLNLASLREEWVSQIIQFIINNFSPSKAIPSKIPDYFYFNTAISNVRMINILEMFGGEPLQISHKIIQRD